MSIIARALVLSSATPKPKHHQFPTPAKVKRRK